MSQTHVHWMLGIGFALSGSMSAYAAESGKDSTLPPRAHIVRVLLITGGHNYEREPFLEVFKGHPDIVVRHVEQPEAQGWFAPEKADQYDVMVWYDLYPKISEEARKNLVALLEKGKPLVALHHALGDYRHWPEIVKILGGHVFLTRTGGKTDFSYKEGVDCKISFPDRRHPIVQGMEPFTLHDETYKGYELLPAVKPLLETDAPTSDKVIGWAHTYGKSPVVYLAPGHGPETYANANYRRLVIQSIRWAAGLLPAPCEEGFVPLFDGKSLDRWEKLGKPDGFTVTDGIIRSESGQGGWWLCSDRTYGDFILRLEWRVAPEGNAGVFIRCAKEGKPWETGNEVQITNEHRDDLHCTGSLYGRVGVDPRPDEGADIWHAFEIQCRGPSIRVFVDGLPVVDTDQRQVAAMKDLPLKGYIGLQDSHNPKGWVEYRNIRIKTLKKIGE